MSTILSLTVVCLYCIVILLIILIFSAFNGCKSVSTNSVLYRNRSVSVGKCCYKNKTRWDTSTGQTRKHYWNLLGRKKTNQIQRIALSILIASKQHTTVNEHSLPVNSIKYDLYGPACFKYSSHLGVFPTQGYNLIIQAQKCLLVLRGWSNFVIFDAKIYTVRYTVRFERTHIQRFNGHFPGCPLGCADRQVGLP